MIDRFIQNLKTINVNSIIAGLLNTEEYQEFITRLNKKRLADKGEYVDGKKIQTFFANTPNYYASRTIDMKSTRSGLSGVSKHVTLYDSGRFYSSFALKVKRTFFAIVASKARLEQLEENIIIDGVLGLTEKDKIIVSQKLVPDVIKELRKKIFAGLS